MCDDTTNCNVNLVTIKEPGHIDLKYNQTNPCGFTQPGDGRCVDSFRQTCQDWVNDLKVEAAEHGGSNYNNMEWIGHIGFWVNRDNSCHCAGKAADISKIKWNGVSCNICDYDFRGTKTQKRRYLGVDASLRKYFKWVLDAWYNSAHHDHFHASSHYETPLIVLSKLSISDTVFVQAVCNNFNDAGIAIDGTWGPETDEAFKLINRAWDFSEWRCNPFVSHDAYLNWLHRVIIAGFADIDAWDVNVGDTCIMALGENEPSDSHAEQSA